MIPTKVKDFYITHTPQNKENIQQIRRCFPYKYDIAGLEHYIRYKVQLYILFEEHNTPFKNIYSKFEL